MIIPMKKVQIVILKKDEKELLTSLQKFSQFMLISDEDTNAIDVSKEETYLNRLQGIINVAETYKTKRKLFEFIDLDYSEFMKNNPQREELVDRIEAIVAKMDLLKAESESYLEQAKAIAPFEGLDISLNKLNPTKQVRFVLGFVESSKLNSIIEKSNEFHFDYKVFNQSQEGTAILLVIHNDEYKDLMQLARNVGFNEVSLPNVEMSVSQLINDLYNKAMQNNQDYEKTVNELKEISSNINELKILNDQISSKVEVKKAPSLKTQDTIYLRGWVRNDKIEGFEQTIKEVTNIYELLIEDPSDDEVPPTYTKNNEFVEPFETITDMFSTPHPSELDPNPVMSWWYWLIFGMMMGDVGYGIVMFILFYGFIKFIKPKGATLKLVKVFLYSSISTIIWGIMFGSYFGFAMFDPVLVNPVDEPIKLMVISLIVGGAHIITGLVYKMYALIKNGQLLDAIFDQLSWILIVIGIGLLFLPDFSTIGQYVAIVGAALILIFGGRNSKNIFGKLFGGVLGLYNITGYMSDILSYSRILALVLSSAVIGSVMNMLAGMVQGSIIGFFFSLLIYVVGHLFNLAMGMLSAYVHDSRLQYIEFFGKFYEGGGYEFKPLTLNLKYINEINDDSKVKGEF